MTPEERTELRQEHTVLGNCWKCYEAPPCRIIRLLDALDAADRLLMQALAALVQTEWDIVAPHYCNVCLGMQRYGHEADCKKGNAIAALRAYGVFSAGQGEEQA